MPTTKAAVLALSMTVCACSLRASKKVRFSSLPVSWSTRRRSLAAARRTLGVSLPQIR